MLEKSTLIAYLCKMIVFQSATYDYLYKLANAQLCRHAHLYKKIHGILSWGLRVIHCIVTYLEEIYFMQCKNSLNWIMFI